MYWAHSDDGLTLQWRSPWSSRTDCGCRTAVPSTALRPCRWSCWTGTHPGFLRRKRVRSMRAWATHSPFLDYHQTWRLPEQAILCPSRKWPHIILHNQRAIYTHSSFSVIQNNCANLTPTQILPPGCSCDQKQALRSNWVQLDLNLNLKSTDLAEWSKNKNIY